MKNKIITVLIASLLGMLILPACGPTSQETPTEVVTEQGLETEETEEILQVEGEFTPYPYPTPRDMSIPTPRTYPGPNNDTNSEPQVVYVVPEPTGSTGVVIGKLLDVNTGDPLPYHTVYLGVKIPLTPGPGFTYGLQEMSSPHTMTDEEGRFALGEVEPGVYILMIFHPEAATVVMEPNSDRELDISVVAGQIVDLEEVEGLTPLQ